MRPSVCPDAVHQATSNDPSVGCDVSKCLTLTLVMAVKCRPHPLWTHPKTRCTRERSRLHDFRDDGGAGGFDAQRRQDGADVVAGDRVDVHQVLRSARVMSPGCFFKVICKKYRFKGDVGACVDFGQGLQTERVNLLVRKPLRRPSQRGNDSRMMCTAPTALGEVIISYS